MISFLYLNTVDLINQIFINQQKLNDYSFKIINCEFLNCITSNSNGGGIQIISTSNITINLCKFYNCIINTHNNGGGSYLSSIISNVEKTCYELCSTGNYGHGLFHESTKNNSLKLTSYNKCSKRNLINGFSSWMLCKGFSILSQSNISLCYSTERESGGHFHSGTPHLTLYNQFERNNGHSIFRPSTIISYNVFHNFNNFINNSINVESIILISQGNQYFYHNIFIKNNGELFKCYSYISLINCFTDLSNFNNINFESNCFFNTLTIFYFNYNNLCLNLHLTNNFKNFNFYLNFLYFIIFL